jgi:hypothetical protein
VASSLLLVAGPGHGTGASNSPVLSVVVTIFMAVVFTINVFRWVKRRSRLDEG